MTTMRSVEPLTGSDAVLVAMFPFMGGTPPEIGEHGIDVEGNIYTWEPGWVMTEPAPEPEAS